MRQGNITDLQYSAPMLPQTHTYQSWQPQHTCWPGGQLEPTLPGFDENEKHLHRQQQGIIATGTLGLHGPEDSHDMPGCLPNPAEDSQPVFGHSVPDATMEGAWYNSRLLGPEQGYIPYFVARDNVSQDGQVQPAGVVQHGQQLNIQPQLQYAVPAHGTSGNLSVGHAYDASSKLDKLACGGVCDAPMHCPAYLCHDIPYQDPSSHYALQQGQSLATGWPVGQNERALPRSAGIPTMERQPRRDVTYPLHTENMDPALQQHQDRRQKDSRLDAQLGSSPVSLQCPYDSTNLEVLPVLHGPSDGMQAGPMPGLPSSNVFPHADTVFTSAATSDRKPISLSDPDTGPHSKPVVTVSPAASRQLVKGTAAEQLQCKAEPVADLQSGETFTPLIDADLASHAPTFQHFGNRPAPATANDDASLPQVLLAPASSVSCDVPHAR